ncbi:hypothetical protein ACFWIN_02175 [Streptomyces sp. NPDC127049]|uniref:hypothetical protein n=1 Tax=Streptomyces sp. NPDC127049 TaxID=3347118 RepID=UPI00365EC801
MDGAAILLVLAIAGVLSITLFSLKGLFDQLPDLIDSIGRVRDAWHRLRAPKSPPALENEEQPALESDEDPPLAA